MKAIVKLYYSSEFEIDLEDYGHSPHDFFESLAGDEQNEICDHLREDAIVSCDIKTLED